MKGKGLAITDSLRVAGRLSAVTLATDASGNLIAGTTFPWISLIQSQVNLAAAPIATYPGHEDATTNTASGFANVQHYLNPADYAVAGKTMTMRVVASFMQNTVVNAATSVATAGLYPTVPGGLTTLMAPTFGAVITGSTAAQTGGAASSEARVLSSSFTAPTADTYTLAVAITVAATLGATRVSIRLEYTYV